MGNDRKSAHKAFWGNPEHLLVQILLVVDGDHTESISAIARMIEEAVLFLQEKIPPRLHLLVLHPRSSHLAVPAAQNVDALVQSDVLTLSSRWVAGTCTFRWLHTNRGGLSGYSTYLLFAALQPTEHGEQHRLFRKPHSFGSGRLVPGFGLVMLLLPEVEDALTHRLLADACSKLNSEPEETAWWRRLLASGP